MKEQTHKPEVKTLTFNDIDKTLNEKVDTIEQEFRDGFDFIKKYPRSVSFFGSARTPDADGDYIAAKSLATRIAEHSKEKEPHLV
jgi:predicted protein tyrosine phosphatase